MRSFGKVLGVVVATALCTAAAGTTTTEAQAATEVTSTGKGIAGGALLGGELGFLTLSAFGARQSWMYYTIPTALAIGGGVGGYFVEQGSSPTIPMYMLAGGMALLIPTIVATLSATSYSANSEDSTPSDATPKAEVKAEAGKKEPGGAAPKHKHVARPLALVNLDSHFGEKADFSVRAGVPLVHVRTAFTTDEVTLFGQKQRLELHAPVVALTF